MNPIFQLAQRAAMRMAFLTAGLLLTVPTVLAQQAPVADVEITIIGEPTELTKIAIPDFKLDVVSGEFDQAWSIINQVLRADLQNSGYFELLERSRMDLIRSPHIGAIDFEEWGSIEADHLVVGSISKTPDGQMRTIVRVYEVASQKTILAKAYNSTPKVARKTAHTIADEILLQLRNTKFANSKIIFVREMMRIINGENRSTKELMIMDYDGYNKFPITRGGIALTPSALKQGDNTLLVYCSYENAYRFNANYGIYFKPNLVSRPRPLFVQRGRRAAAPAISPDGKRVAFSLSENGNVDIYVMNLDGSDLLRLTRHPGIDTNPSWSPGGQSLLYTSDRTGSPQIYMMEANGLNQRRITQNNPYNDLGTWNPKYDYIAYVSRFDNDFDIFILDLQDLRTYRLTRRQGSNEDPDWSPDGERLVFTSNRSGSWQLYSVNRNGENLVQLTREGNNRGAEWIE